MINILWPKHVPITSEDSIAEQRRMLLEDQLRKSGRVPIQVNINMDSIMPFSEIADLLEVEVHRWRIIHLLTSDRRSVNPTLRTRVAQFFARPLPCLRCLHVGNVCLEDDQWNPAGMFVRVEAPSLHTLSCHTYLVLPLSNYYLRYLSITSINLDNLQPPLDRLRLEFRQLVELRITGCNPGAFLAACSTPNLVKLIVNAETLSYTHPHTLSHYLHLRELQWDDRGPDPAFSMLLPRCPNLTRFANYIVGGKTRFRKPPETIHPP
ncbi:hypothetical protein FRB90_006305 [Tulasnella sp. 427]|nr:hypothetical protein FRB90_006305 [Tulasnella sp. 427]